MISVLCSKTTQANQAVNIFTIPLLASIPLGFVGESKTTDSTDASTQLIQLN
jgi:hypothetical protein